MKCAKCGSENSSTAKFCRGCGGKLEVAEPAISASIAACPKCGNVNEPGKKFCEKCGAPAVVTSAPIPATTKLNPPSPHIITPPPAVSLPKHAKAQPAPAKDYTTLIAEVVFPVLLLGILGGVGYWYYQEQETEKAIALQKQQVREARLKAEAAAKEEEARQLAVQVARLVAEQRAQAEQQRLQTEMQQQQAQLAEKQRQRAEEARRASPNVNPTVDPQLIGTWANIDRSGGITRAWIARRGGDISIHMWGRCSPTECDWGEAQARGIASDGRILFRYIQQGIGIRDVAASLAGSSRIRLEIYTKYEDNRSGQRTEFMERDDERQRQQAEAAARQRKLEEEDAQQEAERKRKQAETPKGYVIQGGLTWMPVRFIKGWAEANSYCSNTAINGQNGWRLPTKDELIALYKSGAMNRQGWVLGSTWSSMPGGSGSHYDVGLGGGGIGSEIDANGNYVACVR